MQEISTQRQKELLTELSRLIAYRAQRELEIEDHYAEATQKCRESTRQLIDRSAAEHHQNYENLNSKYLGKLEIARRRHEDEVARVAAERQQRLAAVDSAYRAERDAADLDVRQTQAMAERDYEQDLRVADGVAQQAKEMLESEEAQFAWLHKQARQMLRRRRFPAQIPDPRKVIPAGSTSLLLKRYRDAARRASEQLATANRDFAVRFVDDGWAILVFIAALVAIGLPMGWQAKFSGWIWVAISGLASLVLAVGLRFACQVMARHRTADTCGQLHQSLTQCTLSLTHAADMVDVEHRDRYRELEQRKDQLTKDARGRWELESARLDSKHRAERKKIEDELNLREAKSQQLWDNEARVCRETFPPLLEKMEADHNVALNRLTYERDTRLAELANQHAEQWESLIRRWQTGIESFTTEVKGMREYCQSRLQDLCQIDWKSWQAESEVPRALPFGTCAVDLRQFDGGLSSDPQLSVPAPQFQLPAVLAFPRAPSMLVEADGAGRDQAIRLFQQVMLRMLTSFPAGKVRFTIVDPTGLGQNFSAFMHLADFDERLVANRIWTETNHINQRLSDLTQHMENVIQKYLRNEFASIQQYNEHAGEVAEPFQVLVVANFPANFSDEATRRLVSIATSGAKCGVFTLISVDMKMKFPRNFDLADLEAQANTLSWEPEQQRMIWKDDLLRQFPLTLDQPPEDEVVTRIIRAAGQHATDASRVEVPFHMVVPAQDHWWTSDSRHQIEVALGRAGATKLQFMSLGKGTSQHVLIAGKTGSGKSTLMHAMITNLALHYSPEELQFFLVDFKKGVEFKAYAEFALPHARVVAVESEREFGLSVLQRLDQELQRRGEQFRGSGVQTIGAFRDAHPDDSMPRLLLVVDEFQEFFVNDDKIASEASLLLDRLVRQGRAFGIHVVLGSQTLAGAYSLARSTLGQMAVRIALQCSESDAHLILSEENTAARLLNRPGEAIYNNANGLFEGNHPFQVVWLPDQQREDYLKKLRALAGQRLRDWQPPIVFEGNEAADLASNPLLIKRMHAPAGPHLDAAWLGSAVAIKDPTSVHFRPQSGNHLLVVGANQELADGVLSSAVVSLLVTGRGHGARSRARFLVCDAGRFDGTEMNLGARFSKQIHALDGITVLEPAELDVVIQQLSEEVAQRTDSGTADHPPIYLVIYNLARFRQLRRNEDDFGMSGFGGDEQPLQPAQLFQRVIADGAAVNVHVLLWCDSYNNLNRWFERGTLREFAFRVVFQMSPTDSSNLIDSAAAAQLGPYRAIFYDDERGEYEKFQPYGPPSVEFLGRVGSDLERWNSAPA